MFKVELLNGELTRLHEETQRVTDAVLKGFNDNNRYLIEKLIDQSQVRLSRSYDLVELYLRECNEEDVEDEDEPDEKEDEDEDEESEKEDEDESDDEETKEEKEDIVS